MPHDGHAMPETPILVDLTALTTTALPEVEALFVRPFMELVYDAATVHRAWAFLRIGFARDDEHVTG